MSWREKPCKHCKQIHPNSTSRFQCYQRRNPGKIEEYQRKNRIRYNGNRRKFLQLLRKDTSCHDCNTNYPWYVMEFDHVRGIKHKGIAALAYCSTKRLMEEIDKCDIVCANCHRIRTHSRRKQNPDGTFVNIAVGKLNAAKVVEATK